MINQKLNFEIKLSTEYIVFITAFGGDWKGMKTGCMFLCLHDFFTVISQTPYANFSKDFGYANGFYWDVALYLTTKTRVSTKMQSWTDFSKESAGICNLTMEFDKGIKTLP